MSLNIPLQEYVTKTLIPKCKTRFQLLLLQRRMEVAHALYWRKYERDIAADLGVSRRTVIRDKRWLERNIPDFRRNLYQFRFEQEMKRAGITAEMIEKIESL